MGAGQLQLGNVGVLGKLAIAGVMIVALMYGAAIYRLHATSATNKGVA